VTPENETESSSLTFDSQPVRGAPSEVSILTGAREKAKGNNEDCMQIGLTHSGLTLRSSVTPENLSFLDLLLSSTHV
jgi:hypothetical protein